MDREQNMENFQFRSNYLRDKTLRAKFAYMSEKGDWYLQATLPPLPLKDGNDVERDFSHSTGFPLLEDWARIASKHQSNIRINSDCVTFLTKNCATAGEYKNVPKGTIIYCRIEYLPVQTFNRVGEFFVPNVALYSRKDKNLVWRKSAEGVMDVPTWNTEVTRTKIQEAIGKWQVPEHIRLNAREDEFLAEDRMVLESWTKMLKKDGAIVESTD